MVESKEISRLSEKKVKYSFILQALRINELDKNDDIP